MNSYWVAEAIYEDGTEIKRVYSDVITYVEIEDEILYEFTKLFGSCLEYDIRICQGILNRMSVIEPVKI